MAKDPIYLDTLLYRSSVLSILRGKPRFTVYAKVNRTAYTGHGDTVDQAWLQMIRQANTFEGSNIRRDPPWPEPRAGVKGAAVQVREVIAGVIVSLTNGRREPASLTMHTPGDEDTRG